MASIDNLLDMICTEAIEDCGEGYSENFKEEGLPPINYPTELIRNS